MPKNIVICCDGTGNEFGGDHNSNVVKLYSTLFINHEQAGYYHPGVGTMEAAAARTWIEKRWSLLKGLAFGAGLTANISDAYRFLMNAYADGDRVFIFGFSRGAYTARGLAAMLHMYGLLCPGNEGLIPYITRMFVKRNKAARMSATFDVAEQFKATFSRDCPIHFMGVWDTVSSVGWIANPVALPYAARNPSIKTGRHAIAIHERRCYYRQNLWIPPWADQDIKQVWFTGVHSDVGGSYPEAQSGLAKVTLEWMLTEALNAGLLIDRCRANKVLGRAHQDNLRRGESPSIAPNVGAEIHNSLRRAWWLLEFLPHRQYDAIQKRQKWIVPFGAWRTIPLDSIIYEGVLIPSKRVDDKRLPASYRKEPVAHFPRCEHAGLAAKP